MIVGICVCECMCVCVSYARYRVNTQDGAERFARRDMPGLSELTTAEVTGMRILAVLEVYQWVEEGSTYTRRWRGDYVDTNAFQDRAKFGLECAKSKSLCRNHQVTSQFLVDSSLSRMGENMNRATVSVGGYQPQPDLLDNIGLPFQVQPACVKPDVCSRFNSTMVVTKGPHVYFPARLFQSGFPDPSARGQPLQGEEDADAGLGDARLRYTIYRWEFRPCVRCASSSWKQHISMVH